MVICMQEREKQSESKKINNPTRLDIARLFIALATLVGCLIIAGAGLSNGQLLGIGRSMAMLSVGIMQPEGGVQVLSERLERTPAAGGNPNNLTQNSPSLSYTPGGGLLTSGVLGSSSAINSSIVPAEAGNGGKVIEQQLTTGSTFIQGIAIKNASSRVIDIAAQLKIAPKITIKDTPEPQVLIYHTHTTESYMTYYAGYYNADDAERTKDTTRSVVAVGEAISEQLRTAGIGVVHSVTIHDYPKYSGAYERSAETVKKILKQYPSISVVIDVHRDAIRKSSTEKFKPTVVIDGRKAAQIMLVTSLGDTKVTPNPNWSENLRLSLRLQRALHTQYEGIARPIYLVDSRYNQHLSKGALLIEVGSEANTVSEAVYSGEILGKTLAQVLSTFKK
jgi:stage II sporulation protein P